MSVLFIVGRPAAGKTTVACHIKASIQQRNSRVRIAMIDEYVILNEMVNSLQFPDVKWYRDGTFEIIDRAFFSKTALELEARALSHMRSNDLLLCELARGAYTSVFDAFSKRLKAAMRILYVYAPLGLCRLRNHRRRHDKSGHYLPDSVITRNYTHDDFGKLLARYPTQCLIFDNSKDNRASLALAVRGYVARDSRDLATRQVAGFETGAI